MANRRNSARRLAAEHGRFLAELDLHPYEIERERRLQSQYGWYDEAGVRQGGLMAFLRFYWPILDPATKLVDGWPMWAIAEHLEACARGEITRLLITVPPGFAKSVLSSVYFPAWLFGPMRRPHERIMNFSYSESLTIRDNGRCRLLLTCPEYLEMYGDVCQLTNETVQKLMTSAQGWKLASSCGGVSTGERGTFLIIDDAHSVREAESDRVRSETVRWWREAIPSRFNDLKTGCLVIIGQRVHFDDIAGVALGNEFEYVHLNIPWEFDSSRAFDDEGNPYKTVIGWSDPRALRGDPDGTPAWPERFPPDAIAGIKKELGPYAWNSQYQQAPVARGSAIFERLWWQLWAPPNNRFPETIDYIIASLDGAYTAKTSNDQSAMTVWGVFTTHEGKRAVILMNAWAKHLNFSAPRVERARNESYKQWRERTKKDWGLVEHIWDTCTWLHGKPLKLATLLIENAASGQPAAQELRNRFPDRDFQIVLVKPKGDKLSRALSVQPMFSQGQLYAPNLSWAEETITACEKFPYYSRDDLVDSTTMALRFLRDTHWLQSGDEQQTEEREANSYENVRAQHRRQTRFLYPC